MAYKVYIDGADVFDLNNKKKILISPKITDNLNEASSFEFTMPPQNEFLDNFTIHLLKSTIFVEDDTTGKYVFAGRPSELTWNVYKDIQVYCEGNLAYLNDSIQPKKELNDTTIPSFLKFLIDNHNSQVSDSRKFKIGKCTFGNDKIYRNLNRETTMDALKNMLLQAEGGYVFTRYENGQNYIDYVNDLTEISNQPVRFGVNLQSISIKHVGDNVYTDLVVYGTDDDAEGDDNEVVCSDNPVRNDWLVNQFGHIVRTFDAGSKDKWKDQNTMKKQAQDRLDKHKNDYLVVEATALDLSDENLNFDKYQVGQKAYVISKPHEINNLYPITKVETSLSKRQRIATIGTENNDDLTKITKNVVKQKSDSGSSSYVPYTPPVTVALPTSLSLTGVTTTSISVQRGTTFYNIGVSDFGKNAKLIATYSNGTTRDVTSYAHPNPSRINFDTQKDSESVNVSFTVYYDRGSGALSYDRPSNSGSVSTGNRSLTFTKDKSESSSSGSSSGGTGDITVICNNCIDDYKAIYGDSWTTAAQSTWTTKVNSGSTNSLGTVSGTGHTFTGWWQIPASQGFISGGGKRVTDNGGTPYAGGYYSNSDGSATWDPKLKGKTIYIYARYDLRF